MQSLIVDTALITQRGDGCRSGRSRDPSLRTPARGWWRSFASGATDLILPTAIQNGRPVVWRFDADADIVALSAPCDATRSPTRFIPWKARTAQRARVVAVGCVHADHAACATRMVGTTVTWRTTPIRRTRPRGLVSDLPQKAHRVPRGHRLLPSLARHRRAHLCHPRHHDGAHWVKDLLRHVRPISGQPQYQLVTLFVTRPTCFAATNVRLGQSRLAF